MPDIDLFACAIGPGSFTGLRIGAGFVKGLAHVSHRPAIGVNTLDALARNAADFGDLVCPAISTRAAEKSIPRHTKNGDIQSPYRAVPLRDLLAELRDQRTLFLGDAALKYRDMILGDSPLFSVAPSGHCVATRRLCRLVRVRYVCGGCPVRMHIRWNRSISARGAGRARVCTEAGKWDMNCRLDRLRGRACDI